MSFGSHARSWRCSYCDENWPSHSSYKICPICQTENYECDTKPMALNDAGDIRKAMKAKRERVAAFDLFYETHLENMIGEQVDAFRLEMERELGPSVDHPFGEAEKDALIVTEDSAMKGLEAARKWLQEGFGPVGYGDDLDEFLGL